MWLQERARTGWLDGVSCQADDAEASVTLGTTSGTRNARRSGWGHLPGQALRGRRCSPAASL